MMKGIITVVGKDQVGIIAKVCTLLSDANVNILDISQTILQGYFNMMMIVNLEANTMSFDELVDSLNELGKALEVDIRLQHEQIFDSMHRI
ncbi:MULTISPECIES: ACT domain-containing protein [Zhenhengia]|nr:ACT domain-containing protein [Zhenhengia yiwuensis]MBP3912719.1 ACT domain-containing protein [Niameybacter sp.]MBS5798229.1 ACT domain-containing protein [Clostridiales bacterium]MDU6360491.1 ACT domain-containing protein [Clostridiales bacterium]MDY3367630.1 ACT domain-containing protein [Zhenhengia yiwuensis]